MLTGHECFGEYLCRIGREETTVCHHCLERRDTAQHTLAECPAWEELRRELTHIVGQELSLPVLVTRMVGSDEAWKAAVSFYEAVMLQKGRRPKESAARRRRQPRRH